MGASLPERRSTTGTVDAPAFGWTHRERKRGNTLLVPKTRNARANAHGGHVRAQAIRNIRVNAPGMSHHSSARVRVVSSSMMTARAGDRRLKTDSSSRIEKRLKCTSASDTFELMCDSRSRTSSHHFSNVVPRAKLSRFVSSRLSTTRASIMPCVATGLTTSLLSTPRSSAPSPSSCSTIEMRRTARRAVRL